MKKNLLIISQNYYPEIGSAANRIKNIRQSLLEQNFDVTVLTTEPSYPDRELYKNQSFWQDDDYEEKVIRVKPKIKKYMQNMFYRLMLYLEVTIRIILMVFRLEKSFDFIFVSSPPIFMGIVGLIAKRRFKKPLILDVRDLWPESLLGVGVLTYQPVLKIAYWLEKVMYKEADRIIVNSEYFKRYMLEKGISESKIRFIPNSLTQEELDISYDILPDNDKVSIVYTGNIGLAQNIEKFVDIAERLNQNEYVDFKLIGYGYKTHQIRAIIAERGLNNIKLLKPANRQETLQEIARADIAYVSLADKEVFKTVLPGKLVDYMCLKKPIVGDVSGYCSEIIQKAECGLVAGRRSVNELSDYILELVNDKNLRKQFGNNGYKYACDHMQWNKNINVLIKMLGEIS